MVVLKNYVCAFLRNEEQFLLMKRAPNREINPNFWSGIGGKIEASEMNDPFAACLREIHEEADITSHDVQDLTLRYIIIRRHEDVIRQSYIYFGCSKTKKFSDTDEGTLHWVSRENLADKKFTSTYAEMIKHYLSPFSEDNAIFVGTAESKGGSLQMHWSKIDDFVD
jgi:8-oxo-dGTP diphosphatase